MLYEIQPGHEIEYFLRFYHILWIYKSLSFWQFSINSNQNTTLHTFNICFIHLRIDNNAPMYALGDTAWTRDRIFTKDFIAFYEFSKVCNFDNFSSIWSKTRRCTPSIYALFVYGWIITLQYILWEIWPGHGVEYFFSFH